MGIQPAWLFKTKLYTDYSYVNEDCEQNEHWNSSTRKLGMTEDLGQCSRGFGVEFSYESQNSQETKMQ